MIWISWLIYLIPLVFELAILLVLFKKLTGKMGLVFASAKKFAFLILGAIIVQFLAQLVYVYFQIKTSNIGIYLLKDGNYIKGTLFGLAQPYIESIIIAVIFTLVFYLIYRFYKQPVIDKVDLVIIFLCSILSSYANIFIVIVGSLLLMVFYQIFNLLFLKSKTLRVGISPFLILASMATLVLNNFDFYINFLRHLRLN